MRIKRISLLPFFACALLLTAGCSGVQTDNGSASGTLTLTEELPANDSAVYTERGGVVYAQDGGDGYIGIKYGCPVSISDIESFLGGADSLVFALSEREDTDWICAASVGADVRFVCVKDGKAVRELDGISDMHDLSLCGDRIVLTADNDFYLINIDTGELKALNDIPFSCEGHFIAETEKYIAVESDVVSLYDKTSRTLYYKDIAVADHYCSIDGDDICYKLSSDGVYLTEHYNEKGVFQGYVLYISAECKNEDIGGFINERLSVTIELDEKNDFFALSDGCLYSRDMKTLYAAPYDTENEHLWIVPKSAEDEKKEFTVPESVENVAPRAFFRAGTGRPLCYIYFYEKVPVEDINALELWEGTKVYYTRGIDTDAVEKKIAENERYASLLNGDAERELLIKNTEELFGAAYLRDNVTVSYSRAAYEKYTDIRFYVYSDGVPKYIVVPVVKDGGRYLSSDGEFAYDLYYEALTESSRYYGEAVSLYDDV